MFKNRRLLVLFALLLSIGLVLGACGSSGDEEENTGGDSGGDTNNNEEAEGEGSGDFSVAMVTDVGGVDDKSFNQQYEPEPSCPFRL